MNICLKARKLLGATQVQFAHIVGVSSVTVCRWETGAREMGVSLAGFKAERFCEEIVDDREFRAMFIVKPKGK